MVKDRVEDNKTDKTLSVNMDGILEWLKIKNCQLSDHASDVNAPPVSGERSPTRLP